MKIGITGATGQLGNLVVENLKKLVNNREIVALVRDTNKAADLGVEARTFDYDQPASLESGLQGVETLLLISANEIGKREAQHKNVINAAKKANVSWIVYTSLLHADATSINLAGEHVATENALKASGITHTILRNGWYTENYTGSIQGALAGGAFVGSAGEGKIASAARADFAEAAAKVLTDKSHQGKTYELAGDSYYTLTDLATEISKQTGKNIPYNNLPEGEYAQILKSFGLPEVFAEAIASWDVSASKGDLFNDGNQLSTLIGHRTTPLSQSVKEALQ